jgi:hypothetical protein
VETYTIKLLHKNKNNVWEGAIKFQSDQTAAE